MNVNSSSSKIKKSHRRVTDLINMRIVKRTEKIYPDETKFILVSTNLMRRVTSISKDAVTEFSGKRNLQAILNLFARNRELVHFSMVCLMNGGYAPTKVLSRAALENALCMRLFNKKPELAKKWFTNPEKFREDWKPQRIRDELYPKGSDSWKAYNELYWRLCAYAHPSLKGWREMFREMSILWHPVFNEDHASECIGLVFFIIIHSLLPFARAFEKWLPKRLSEEVDKLLQSNSQMLARHFQVK